MLESVLWLIFHPLSPQSNPHEKGPAGGRIMGDIGDEIMHRGSYYRKIFGSFNGGSISM